MSTCHIYGCLQKAKEANGFPGAEITVLENCWIWVLGTKFRSSARAAPVPNPWAISPTLKTSLLMKTVSSFVHMLVDCTYSLDFVLKSSWNVPSHFILHIRCYFCFSSNFKSVGSFVFLLTGKQLCCSVCKCPQKVYPDVPQTCHLKIHLDVQGLIPQSMVLPEVMEP